MPIVVTVILPFYNETEVRRVIDLLLRVSWPSNVVPEIIAVDDGSQIHYVAGLAEYIEKCVNIQLVTHTKNLGKGAAIKTALSLSSGNIIVVQDGDLEYCPFDIPTVIQPIIDGKTRVCYGSRHLNKMQRRKHMKWLTRHAGQAFLPMFGGRLITAVCNLLYRAHLSDVLTCYKAFDAGLLKSLNLTKNGFHLEAEITAQILKQTTIIEVPVQYTPRTRAEGKKIRLYHGILMLCTIVAERWRKQK